MADVAFRITAELSPALKRALGEAASGALLADPLRAYLTEGAEALRDRAAAEARLRGVGERLANAHVVEVDHAAVPAWAEVRNTEPYAPFVHGTEDSNYEWGRRPGRRMPPPDALRDWAGAHGIDTDASALFLIARHIAREGIRARPWLRDAAAAEESSIHGSRLEAFASHVAAQWARG